MLFSSSSPATDSYTPRSFLINGKPDLLLSAGIHYFRVPAKLWADRIAKARRGGMNTIETYVAWNYHEPAPGQFDFTGDRDLDGFLAECERQGMYVIVRPGPYICAEWDYGGFPAWLQTVPGIAFRTMNRPYQDAVDRYLDAVCPIIARHQTTRGGNVVLVQVENEYANLKWTRGADMEVDDAYQQYVRDALISRQIDVPLITCEGYCSETVEGVNAHNPGDKMPAFRQTFPDKPLFATEFWTGWYDAWGLPHHTRPASDVEYASWRCFAEGACGYNYYVYAGGTNFGYTPMYRQTTSYDYDAPLSETGRPTDKWRACRRVAQFAQTFKDILLSGEHRRDLRATGGLRVHETATRQRGSIVWVDNPGTEATAGSVFPYLPDVTLGSRELFAYVHDWPILPPELAGERGGRYLDSYVGLVKSDAPVLAAHLLPDPYPGARVYVYGAPGQQREVALFNPNQRGTGTTITFREEPQVYRIGESQIVALPDALSGRVFIAPDDDQAPVIIGPDDVPVQSVSTATVEVAPGKVHNLYALTPDGNLTEINVDAPSLPAPPTLTDWETVAEPDCTALDFDDSDWVTLDDVAEEGNLIRLNIAQEGAHAGSNPYGWYRAHIGIDEGCDANVHFAACSDRLTVWVNGEKVGSSAIPPEERKGDWQVSFDLRLKEGDNVITVLADNLGLIKGDWQIGRGQEHEKKGIYGPVTLTPSGGCYQMDVRRWQFRGLLHGERSGWQMPRATWQSAGDGPVRWHRAAFHLDAVPGSAMPLRVRLDGMHKGVLWINGHNAGRYWVTAKQDAEGASPPWLPEQRIFADMKSYPQRDYYLPEPWLRTGKNHLVFVETEGSAADPVNVSLVWDDNAAATLILAL